MPICPTCHRQFKHLERHWAHSYYCDPAAKKNTSNSTSDLVINLTNSNQTLLSNLQDAPKDSVSTLHYDHTVSLSPRRSQRKRDIACAIQHKPKQKFRTDSAMHKNAASQLFSSQLDDYVGEYNRQQIRKDAPIPPTELLSCNTNHLDDDTSCTDENTSWIFAPNLIEHVSANTADESSSVAAVAAMVLHQEVRTNAPQLDDDFSSLGKELRLPIDIQDAMSLVATPIDRSMAELYYMADNAGAPRHLVDDIISKMRDESQIRNFSPFDPSITKRTSFFQRMAKQVNYVPPNRIPLTLESGQRVTIHRFNYIEDLKKMLVSSVYADLSNLRCDLDRPFSNEPPRSNTTQAPHLLDFSWYKRTYHDHFCTVNGTSNNETLYHLLILNGYTDATSRALRSIEPVTIVDARLTDEAKRDRTNWIILGYMPYIEKISSAMRKTFSSRGAAEDLMSRDYHRCMSVILGPLIDFCEGRPILRVRRGSIIKTCSIITEFALWSLDNKAADMACGKLHTTGPLSTKITRRCHCSFEMAREPHHCCIPMNGEVVKFLSQAALGPVYGLYTTSQKAPELHDGPVTQLQRARFGRNMDEILGTVDDAVLHLPTIPLSDNCDMWLKYIGTLGVANEKRKFAMRARQIRQACAAIVLKKIYCTKVVDNPFHQLSYGANVDGIFAATTADILHVLKNGIFPKLTETIFHPMTNSQLSAIDLHVEKIFGTGHNRGSASSEFPRVSFMKGYTKLTELRGYERVGQLFVLAFLLRTSKGGELLAPRIADDFEKKRAALSLRHSSKAQQPIKQLTAVDTESDSDSHQYMEDGNSSTVHHSLLMRNTPEFSSIWSIDRCLVYLRLTTIQSVVNAGSLPAFLHEKLQLVLSEFFSVRTIKTLMKASELNGELPRATNLGYRPLQEISMQEIKQHMEAGKSKMFSFPKSETKFQTYPSKAENSVRLDLDQLSYVVETLLTFLGFCEYAPRSCLTTDIIKSASRCLELMRRVIVKGIDRKESSYGWSFQKFVEMVHILMETPEFGRGGGKDTNDQEAHMKGWAVRPSKTAQKRDDATFTGQISLRVGEAGVLERIRKSNKVVMKDVGLVCSTTNQVDQSPRVGQLQKMCMGRGRLTITIFPNGSFELKKKKNCFQIDPVVMSYFIHSCQIRKDDESVSEDGSVTIELFTEAKLPNDLLIRAHPNFNGDGCWYDCFMIAADKTNSRRPAKIVAIYKDTSLWEEAVSPENCPTHVLAITSLPQTNRDASNNSQLFRQWSWKSLLETEGGSYRPFLQSFPIRDVQELVYCIDVFPSKASLMRPLSEHFVMLEASDPRKEWARSFLNSERHLTKKMRLDTY